MVYVNAIAYLDTQLRYIPGKKIRKDFKYGKDYFGITSLIRAFERIKSRKGNMTPGPRGVTLDGISINWFWKTSLQLLRRKYKPGAVLRVEIPKGVKGIQKLQVADSDSPTGGIALFDIKTDKTRPLGIPNPRDKIVQEALRNELEKKMDGKMSDRSYAYRSTRTVKNFREDIKKWKGVKWIIEGDIKGYFDNIDHKILLRKLKEWGATEHELWLTEKILKAGVVIDGKWHPTQKGTPQGGVISPLLANIYLDVFDRWAEKQGEYARYADDWIIGVKGVKSVALRIKEEAGVILDKELKLELAGDKTKLTKTEKKARFLGYDITRRRIGGKLGRIKKDRLGILKPQESKTKAMLLRMEAYKYNDRTLDLEKMIMRNLYRAIGEELGYYRDVMNRELLKAEVGQVVELIPEYIMATDIERLGTEGPTDKFRRKRWLWRPYEEKWKELKTKFDTEFFEKRREKVKSKWMKPSLLSECIACGSKEGLRVRVVKRIAAKPEKELDKFCRYLKKKSVTLCGSCNEVAEIKVQYAG